MAIYLLDTESSFMSKRAAALPLNSKREYGIPGGDADELLAVREIGNRIGANNAA